MATTTVTGEILFVDPDRITILEDCGKFKRRWTIWDQTGVKGRTVSATGELATSTRPWTGKDGIERIGVDHVLRKATITPTAGTGAPQTPANDGWGQVDESTPF